MPLLFARLQTLSPEGVSAPAALANAAAYGIALPTISLGDDDLSFLTTYEATEEELSGIDKPDVESYEVLYETLKPEESVFPRLSSVAGAGVNEDSPAASAVAESRVIEVIDTHDNTVYASVETGAESDEIADGWEAVLSEEGETFYYNPETGETQWDKPVKVIAAINPRPPAVIGEGIASSVKAFSGGSAPRFNSTNNTARANAVSRIMTTPAASYHTKVIEEEIVCDSFEPNPFKADICKHCRKKKEKHST